MYSKRLAKYIATLISIPIFFALSNIVFVNRSAGANAEIILNEYEVKAAYLYNFTKFVAWPADTFPTETTPFVIAILGIDPFGAVLDRSLEGKEALGRKLVLRRINWPADLRDVQILFLSPSESRRSTQILEQVGHRPILTVTESEDLRKSGCMINLFMEAQKVRLQIDANKAEHAKIKINSKLLSLARVVYKGEQ